MEGEIAKFRKSSNPIRLKHVWTGRDSICCKSYCVKGSGCVYLTLTVILIIIPFGLYYGLSLSLLNIYSMSILGFLLFLFFFLDFFFLFLTCCTDPGIIEKLFFYFFLVSIYFNKLLFHLDILQVKFLFLLFYLIVCFKGRFFKTCIRNSNIVYCLFR
jgi:hypothetical protein